jgi:hypothetical protein
VDDPVGQMVQAMRDTLAELERLEHPLSEPEASLEKQLAAALADYETSLDDFGLRHG